MPKVTLLMNEYMAQEKETVADSDKDAHQLKLHNLKPRSVITRLFWT